MTKRYCVYSAGYYNYGKKVRCFKKFANAVKKCRAIERRSAARCFVLPSQP